MIVIVPAGVKHGPFDAPEDCIVQDLEKGGLWLKGW